MTLKMDSRDDRIGRSVSLGEMLGLSGVMPPTDASQRGWIREEQGDDGFDISRFHDRLTSELDHAMETSVFEVLQVLKTGTPVDDR